MKLISKKENSIVFQTSIEETLANAIRKYLNQIQVPAIDEVEISKNDSPLYDETISHRIGLIPLKADKISNEKTPVKLKLNVKKEGMVYSGNFKGAINVVYDKIPITSLNKDQELEITGIVKFGKGGEHAKFSPGLMFYRNIFDIKIDKECPKEVVGVCPQNILKFENGKVIAKDVLKCDICEACLDFCKKQKKDSIKITPTNELIITLESFGQLETKEIFKNSIDVLRKDLNDISKKISK